MKKHLGLLFLLFAACMAASPDTVPTPPAAARDADFRTAWAKVAPAPAALFATLAERTPLPRTRYQQGQNWFEVSGHLSAFEHKDDAWQQGFSIEWAPGCTLHAYGTTDGQAGAVVNLDARFEGRYEGPFVHAMQVQCPRPMLADDGLIITSTTTAKGSRGPLPYPGGRSDVDEILPVAFVRWTPGPQFFRPPVIGNTELALFFRRTPLPIAAMQLQKLGNAIDPAQLGVDFAQFGKGIPSVDRLTAIFARYHGEVTGNWATDTFSADWQNVGYGREQASTASKASLRLLCSDVAPTAKAKLARNLCQRGFDVLGALAGGRGWPSVQAGGLGQCNGGHGNGRKALLILLGWLIGCEPLRNPTALLGPCFAEDYQYVAGSTFYGGTSRWRYNSTGDSSAEWVNQPAQWSAAWAWQCGGYFEHCCGSQVGTALFMRLTNNVDAMGTNLDAVVAAFMSIDVPTIDGKWWVVEGNDWSVDDGKDFCAAAWKRYAQ